MAADSQVSICERPMPGAVKKVLRVPAAGDDGEVLLGIAGDGALAGLVRQFVTIDAVPAEAEDPQPFADQVALLISSLAREHGVLDDDRLAGMLLLGWDGRLWTIVHAQAIPHLDGIGAVGSGADAALGAVHALLELGEQPLEAVVRAVQIAARLDLNTAEPIHIDMLTPRVEGGQHAQ